MTGQPPHMRVTTTLHTPVKLELEDNDCRNCYWSAKESEHPQGSPIWKCMVWDEELEEDKKTEIVSRLLQCGQAAKKHLKELQERTAAQKKIQKRIHRPKNSHHELLVADLKFECNNFADKTTTLDKCEAKCERYLSCDKAAQANDIIRHLNKDEWS